MLHNFETQTQYTTQTSSLRKNSSIYFNAYPLKKQNIPRVTKPCFNSNSLMTAGESKAQEYKKKTNAILLFPSTKHFSKIKKCDSIYS